MICVPDSLLQIYKGKRVYKNVLLCQTNLNDTESALFLLGNEETKCLCSYFDREWRSALVTVFTFFCCCYAVARPFSTRLNLTVKMSEERSYLARIVE